VTATSRREALRQAAIGAGVIAAGSVLAPAAALAQSPDDEDLRDFLVEAIGLEQVAAFAYAQASKASDANAQQTALLEHLRDQEQAHANAFRQALESIGFDPPDAPDAADDSGVFDDVEGLDDEAAGRLTEQLAGVGELDDLKSYVEYLGELETAQLDYYLASAPTLDSPDLATTCAEVAANQAQHEVLLATLRGPDAAEVVLER
jgi:rubrerythrin